MSEPQNVLFICTHNSGRSILSECLLNSSAQGRFKAYSAGSLPSGVVNPFAIDLLKRNRISTDGLRSKSWEEFMAPTAPKMSFIFTVCDDAAGETCPVWPGQPITAHWGIPNPDSGEGSDEEKRRSFFQAFNQLQHRISIFVNLPIDKLDHAALKSRLEDIGKSVDRLAFSA